ncbi:MAG: septum formation initiator [Corynebacterium sp.]|uniref:septum site-determining protein Ssd n=1 Tax=Corynebacterium sp. TaxID=1720 RepID=UPI0026DFDE18|nr:septum site-determining protein Ssd [Corynebacterium sp.]MDO5668497.1 septum formation initiator [Corynebacterium sp.]
MTSTFILVAVGDPVIHPEAMHVAAATGHGIVDTMDPREITRLLPRAHSVLIDADTAGHVATLDRRPGIHFLAPDPGPVDWQSALRGHAENAYVLPAQAPELLATLGHASAAGEDRQAVDMGPGTVIAVCGSSGGAGASTLAVAVARVAARSHPVTIVDADALSGGLDLLLGLEDDSGVRWPELQLGEGAVAGSDIRAVLPTTGDGIACLSAARSTIADPYRLTPQLLAPVLQALSRESGVTIVDFHPAGPLADVVVEASDRVVILIPCEVRPAAAATRLCADFISRRAAVTTIARQRYWAGLSASDVTRITGREVITSLSTLQGIPKLSELGGLPERLPGPLVTTARLVLEDAGVTR